MRIQNTSLESFPEIFNSKKNVEITPKIRLFCDTISKGSPASPAQNFFHKAINIAKQIFLSIFYFFRTCLCSERKSDSYYKIDTDENIHYKLDDTDNEVKLGLKIVDLKEISFPDKNKLPVLRKMLRYIMKNEMIDRISVNNLYHAWMLWKAGLKTSYSLQFDPKAAFPKQDDPKSLPSLSGFIKETIASAKKREAEGELKEKSKKALEKIERKLMQAVMEESISVKETIDTKEIYDIEYDLNKITRHCLALQGKLNINFDLDTLIEKAPQDSKEKEVLSAVKQNINKGFLSWRANCLSSYEIPLDDFFYLLQSSDKEIGRDKGRFTIPKALFARS